MDYTRWLRTMSAPAQGPDDYIGPGDVPEGGEGCQPGIAAVVESGTYVTLWAQQVAGWLMSF